MGQSSEELNAEIEGTRSSLSSDLDALQDRVSPSAIVGRQKDAARDRVTAVKSKVMGSGDSASGSASEAAGKANDAIVGSPLAAGLVAFGAGLVIAALLPASRTETRAAQQLSDAAKEHGQPALDQAKSAASDIGTQLKDSATEKAQDLKASATESAQTVKDEGATSASSVADTAKPS